MLRVISTFSPSPKKPQINQVCCLFSLFATTSRTNSSLSPPKLQPNETQVDSSSVDFSGIAESVISRCSHLFETKKQKSIVKASLKDLLLDISDVIPDAARHFRRFLVLKPEDVLQILLGFESECKKVGFRARKVETLWELFKWTDKQNVGFKHLPKSCEVMASMLNKAGMLKEVELLLLAMEIKGISMDSEEVFSDLIEGYVRAGDSKRVVFMFDRMRGRGLVPSLSCYSVFLDLLFRMKRSLLAFRVCMDLVKLGIDLNHWGKASIENIVKRLCSDRKIQEARTLVRKVMAVGFEPSSLVLNEIACGYCEKKDFKDLLSFFIEMNHAPDVVTGNKIIHAMSSNFGVENAEFFRQDLEYLGFVPDEVTFGILIGWSCREGNLRGAFIYLSEILSRGLKPDVKSYNALISGLFKEGLWEHARDMLDEMLDLSISPDFSTFRTLLAGYCRARRLDEAKMIVTEIANRDLIELSSLEDPLSKAFEVLGLSPLAVRVKRDNDVGLVRTEFYDFLGNGLYLDTDLDAYDNRISVVLEDSMMPDFNLLVMKECDCGNLTNVQLLINEMVRWGQGLSLSVFSAVLKGLCKSGFHLKAVTSLLETMPELAARLDEETLNLLVQTYSKKGLTYKGRAIFNEMIQKGLKIKNETYTDLILGLCRRGNLKDLRDCWDIIAQKDNWLLGLEDAMALVRCLTRKTMLREALELLKIMLISCPRLELKVFQVFMEMLCVTGYASISRIMVEELLWQGCVLDPVIFGNLLRGLCMEKKFSVAFKILDMMLAKKLTPCTDVSIILIPQMCIAGKFKDAVALRDILLEQSTFTLSVDGALIKGFCMMGKTGEADSLFQEIMKGILLDADIYNTLVQGHCQAKNLRKVCEIFGSMIRKNISLSISSYRNFVHLMCVEGRLPYALNLKVILLGQIESPSVIVYNILLFYFFLAGDCLFVNKVLNEMQEKGLQLDENTYDYLVYGFSQCKDVLNSVHYFSTMISKGHRPSNRSLRTIISRLCEIGQLDRALELSQEMEVRGWVHDSTVQNAIVESLLSCGKLREAEQFLDRILDKGLVPDSVNYDNLIKRFCSCERLNKAVDLLNIMLKKGNVPNSTSYDAVIYSLCACNKLHQAMDFHTEMLDRNLKPSIKTWDVLVHKFCKEGLTAEAGRILNSMIRLGETPTKEMYSSVIDRYRFENNLRKASELMQAMQQSGYEPDFDTHWSLISNLSSSNDKENRSQGFLSSLLSGSGFTLRKDSKAKLG